MIAWNYKAAVLSAVVRGHIFLLANLSAGADAAVAAFGTELWFRLLTSGFYGALTQAFSRIEPARASTLGALIVVPVVSHSLELAVHRWRGTEQLTASIAASIAFTVVSTSFNLFAMRRGALVVGAGSRSLLDDLRAVPRLMAAFASATVRTVTAAL